jgi:dipeptidyl aminopeptidase/acylaminoacyl peptidase
MQPDDLAVLRTPSAPTVSPDGRTVVYALTRIDPEADAYRSQLWTVPADGGAPPRPLTLGPRDAAPRFSPDGRWIAFVRAAEDGPPQLHVMAADSGEPRRVCDHPLGVAGPTWAPDSRRIAYLARVPEEGRYGTDDDVPPDKEPARRITTRKYRLDGVGYTTDRRLHVFTIDALAGADGGHAPEGTLGEQLTRGDFDHGGPAWSPDGSAIAFTSARHDRRDHDLAADVHVIPAAGGDARRVTRTSSTAGDPVFTPDGTTILFTGHGQPRDIVGRTTGIFAVPVDGSAAPRRLTDAEQHEISDPFALGPSPLLVEDDAVLTVRLNAGAVELVRFPLNGQGRHEPVVKGPRSVRAFARAADTTVAIIATDVSAGEVIRLDDEGEHPLTAHGAELARTVPLQPMLELTTTAPDGYPVHGWLVLPPDTPVGTGPHPVLLNVHGGPYTQYGYTLFDEAQVYAAAGYAVVLGNPRGSQGYGQAHGRAIVHDMGNLDRVDVLALLDVALERDDLDGERVGVMGGSYGGFMTTLLAATTDRFRAGISERALNAWDSFAGSSDIGSFFVDLYAGTDPERIRAQDPLARADDIRCPLLIIHSEQDLRCPLEQAQRLFERLLRNGVETELVLFPGEGHELSRSGLPSHRIQRFEAILDWWSRHLA